MGSEQNDQPLTPEAVRRFLRSRRMQERLIHLSYYRDEPPAQSLLRGLALSEAAHRSRTTEG